MELYWAHDMSSPQSSRSRINHSLLYKSSGFSTLTMKGTNNLALIRAKTLDNRLALTGMKTYVALICNSLSMCVHLQFLCQGTEAL